MIEIAQGRRHTASAVGVARALDERGIGPDRVQVTVVNATRWHCIRVRNYEADLSDARVPLADIFEPIRARLMVAEVVGLSLADRTLWRITLPGL